MTTHVSDLSEPVDAVIFDCDGTLTNIEGIDFLAEQNGVGRRVTQMTQEAMGRSGLTPDIYRQRLELVRPTFMQVKELGQHYFSHVTPDTISVIQLLNKLNKKVYIISAGLLPSVLAFGKAMQVPEQHIFAVDIFFDAHGHYQDFDTQSPLVSNNGKREIVSNIKNKHPRIAYVGDGMNDLSVIDVVTRFIGYGGTFYRKNIEMACSYY